MLRKLVFLTTLVMMLTMAGSAIASFTLKFDIAVNAGGGVSVDYTDKSKQPGFEDWKAWVRYGADKETHDATNQPNAGGTGITIGIGAGDGSSAPGTVLDFSTSADDPICNTWIRSGGEGHPDGSVWLILASTNGFNGLVPGTYWVYGYHNTVGGSEPNMPNVTAVTASILNGVPTDNFGYTSDPDGEGVVVEFNDVNIPILSTSDDNDLEVARSLVKFYTDGSPVAIRYEGGDGGTAALNAFIVIQTFATAKAGKPFPEYQETQACPDTTLTWESGAFAEFHQVYFGTDWDDVNDATTSTGGIYKGQYSVDSNNYTPPATLDFDTTYYWRVDEVNDSNLDSPWKGNVWEFNTESGEARNPSPADHAGSQSESGIVLGWTSSCLATSGDYIYFGTDFDDVNDGDISVRFGPILNQSYFTGTLDSATKYYWRVDAVGGALPKSPVWSFQTSGYPLVYFKFDGIMGADVGNIPDANFLTDSTGNVTFSVAGNGAIEYDESNPLYNNIGTSAQFILSESGESGSRLLRSSFGPDLLDLDGPAYTIQAWVRHDGPAANVRDDDMHGTIIRKDQYAYGLGVDDDGYVKYMHSGEVISSQPSLTRIGFGEWHHVAAVFDESDTSDQMEKLYIDGLLVADNNDTNRNPVDDYSTDDVGIGAMRRQYTAAARIQNYFDGAIDELHIIDQALSPNEFLIRGDANLAWLPNPSDFATEVPYGTSLLVWQPGDNAVSHNVYLGTSWDDVNDATTSDSVFIGNRTEPDLPDPGPFALDTTYYWRVDEVGATETFKGRVWRFTIANYILIDDMESYDPFVNRIWYSWDNPWGNGAFIDLGTTGFAPVHGGLSSMEYLYDNAVKWDFFSYYSETEYNLASPQDWLAPGVKLLTAYFYGDPENDANVTEQMYVGLSDGTDRVDVDYPTMSDIHVDEWTEWNVELSDFTGVDMDAIQTVYLGFGSVDNTTTPGGDGIVYFDDLRVYPPKCVPALGPALDFSGDCLVGLAEVAMMGDEWLTRDLVISPLVAPNPSVLHYALDESSGSSVTDSAGSHTGTFFNDVNQTPADLTAYMDTDSVSGNSIHFSHDDDANVPGIMIPASVFSSISQEISLAMWIKNVHTDETPDGDAYLLEFREWVGSPDANDRVIAVQASEYGDTYIFHDSSESIFYDQDWDAITEWTHYAFVRNADNLMIYVNGLLEEIGDSNGTAMATPGLLYLGLSADRAPNNNDGLHDGFTGNIDDFMIFDYALSDAQAGHLGTAGTGYVPMPPATMDLYDGEAAGSKAVNFRDYAVLMNNWLEEILWPE